MLNNNFKRFINDVNNMLARHIKNKGEINSIYIIKYDYDMCCVMLSFNRRIYKGIDSALFIKGLDQHTLWFYDAPAVDAASIKDLDKYLNMVKLELTKQGRAYNMTINDIKYGTLTLAYIASLELLMRKDIQDLLAKECKYSQRYSYNINKIKEIEYDYSERDGMDLSYTETDTKIIHLVTTARKAYIEALKKKREGSILNNPLFNSTPWERATVSKINEVVKHGKA